MNAQEIQDTYTMRVSHIGAPVWGSLADVALLRNVERAELMAQDMARPSGRARNRPAIR
jgi:hypothetical protein